MVKEWSELKETIPQCFNENRRSGKPKKFDNTDSYFSDFLFFCRFQKGDVPSRPLS